MRQIGSPSGASRRPLAVGIWSSVLVLMALVPSGVSTVAAFGIVLLVSIISAVALLLVEGNWPRHQVPSTWNREVPVAVAVLIPLGWAMLLGVKSSVFSNTAFVSIALIPAYLALMTRTLPAVRALKDVTPDAPTAGESSQIEAFRVDEPALINDTDEVSPTVRFDAMREPPPASSPANLPVPPPNITQWLTRSQTIDSEIIEGGVRINFADGQRDATVHISFCPPFRSIPAVTAEDLDGADLEIRVSATFHFGARLTVRRRSQAFESDKMPTSTRSCRIAFVAVADPVRRAA